MAGTSECSVVEDFLTNPYQVEYRVENYLKFTDLVNVRENIVQ